jgi:hypothetical protein
MVKIIRTTTIVIPYQDIYLERHCILISSEKIIALTRPFYKSSESNPSTQSS